MAKVFIEETTLTNIGNAIRDKEGSSALIPVTDMATRIAAIETGGGGDSGIPEEAFHLTGSTSYKFAHNSWNWFIEQYGNQITTSDLGAIQYMFYNSSELKNIPFQLNIKNGYLLSKLFAGCLNLTTCPKIRGTLSTNSYQNVDLSDVVESCTKIRDFEDLFEPSMLDSLHDYKVTSAYSCHKVPNFENCYSMRRVPSWFHKFRHSEESTAYPNSSYSVGYYTFSNCYALDEIVDFPVARCNGELTKQMWDYFVPNCNRLKNFTFETDNGTPYVVKWKSQTIDLSNYVGYLASNTDYYKRQIINFNSGITADKAVNNAEEYQALKNDPDWFTGLREYSRYNHDSAVATINSLPDTSAYLAGGGGTNTIKFKGDAGSATDGGAINTLTEEEIAVAAAKGWTVTIA